jgi:hypothetical protein
MYNPRHKFIELVETWKMPKTDLATLASVVPARISDFIQDKPLPPAKAERIATVISEVAEVFAAFHPFKIDISNREHFALALEHVRAYGANRAAEDLDALLNNANKSFEMALSVK